MNGRQRRQGRHPEHGFWLSLEQAAAFTPVGPGFIAEQTRKGRGPDYYEFGPRMWFLRKDVESWIESLRRSGGRPCKDGSGHCPTCGRPLS